MNPPEREQPQTDTNEAIGDTSAEHRELRLACLREARAQAEFCPHGFGDILYRARLNADFVLNGTTPRIRLRSTSEEPGARE